MNETETTTGHEAEPETIRYTGDAVVVRPDESGTALEVLMVERLWDPYAGALALPGGHIDKGETSREGTARELAEEAGLRVDAEELELLGVYDAPGRDPRGRYVSVAYLVRVSAGTEAVAGDDAKTVHWVPLADLPERIAFDHAAILADARTHLAETARTATR
ncbi:NUDIX domain-containing protein [Kitasatospora cineracea]|uniref:8-oxo-dGTP diphosphatase n=1 Tax=Kitasatospora cineracea TaxID=88074 RepID=A0A3N4R0E6_9ACTN|nr:NUDIX hydrolase [Kitasatospora cineracea]RPE26592.1 8-oxo-dGTP diphosphatase [Kitasatospora cineracea]